MISVLRRLVSPLPVEVGGRASYQLTVTGNHCGPNFGNASILGAYGPTTHSLFREELSKFKWAFPCFWWGLNACLDGLGTLFTTTTVILQIFLTWSQSARLSAGRGSNRYLGNAQMQST